MYKYSCGVLSNGLFAAFIYCVFYVFLKKCPKNRYKIMGRKTFLQNNMRYAEKQGEEWESMKCRRIGLHSPPFNRFAKYM